MFFYFYFVLVPYFYTINLFWWRYWKSTLPSVAPPHFVGDWVFFLSPPFSSTLPSFLLYSLTFQPSFQTQTLQNVLPEERTFFIPRDKAHKSAFFAEETNLIWFLTEIPFAVVGRRRTAVAGKRSDSNMRRIQTAVWEATVWRKLIAWLRCSLFTDLFTCCFSLHWDLIWGTDLGNC